MVTRKLAGILAKVESEREKISNRLDTQKQSPSEYRSQEKAKRLLRHNDPALKSESQIQREILEWLRSKGFQVWRVNTTGMYDVRSGTFRASTSKGMSDIIGLTKDGRFLAIEVKTMKGKVSIDQKVFIDLVNANGGAAFVARGIKDLEEKLAS